MLHIVCGPVEFLQSSLTQHLLSLEGQLPCSPQVPVVQSLVTLKQKLPQ